MEHAPTIYMDYNATAPVLEEVADAIREALLRYPANPASQHSPGQEARRALQRARGRIAELLGARTTGLDADRLVFTSGGTEANNLLLLGMLASQSPGHAITSAIEHPAILKPIELLEQQGWQITRVGANSDGIVCEDQLAAALTPKTRLVTIMAANNETGVVQPLRRIAALCGEHQVPLHTDAAQRVGKLPIHFAELQLAGLSCSAHKFHGPPGIGALLARHDLPLRPLMFGGHQQQAVRPGTESVALAVGMQTALEIWQQNSHDRTAKLRELQRDFEQEILVAIPTAQVIGVQAERLPNTSNIAFPGVDRQAFFLALDLAGVACSTGSACASGSSEPSPVHLAMGLPTEWLNSALRFSWSVSAQAVELHAAARRIIKTYNHLQQATN